MSKKCNPGCHPKCPVCRPWVLLSRIEFYVPNWALPSYQCPEKWPLPADDVRKRRRGCRD